MRLKNKFVGGNNMKKSELNQNIYLSEGNLVLKQNEDYGFLVFSLIARECCPYATELCKKICYGRGSQELFKHVYNVRKKNYEESLKDTFVEDMIDIIKFNLQRKKYKNKTILFRIHETGDFYSQPYTNKWFKIANYFKDEKRIIFQCYTKSLPFIKDKKQISNLKIMYSIMPDTKSEDIALAKKLGLNTFTAIPLKVFEELKDEEHKCKGDCSRCKECYVGSKDMTVEFHGSRCGSLARTDYKKRENKKSVYGDIGNREIMKKKKKIF